MGGTIGAISTFGLGGGGGLNIIKASRPLQYTIFKLYVLGFWGGYG